MVDTEVAEKVNESFRQWFIDVYNINMITMDELTSIVMGQCDEMLARSLQRAHQLAWNRGDLDGIESYS